MPMREKKTGAEVVADPPIVMSLVDVALETTSFAKLYVQLRSVEAPGGQFAPFARHTEDPFTAMAEAFNVVPEAVVNPNHEVEVPCVKVRLVRLL